MSARLQDYPAPGYSVRVPAPLWRASLAELEAYGQLSSEGLVYLTGVVASPVLVVVTGLLKLGHRAQGGTVVVSKDEARWLVRTTRTRDEKLIAQVHSHAGEAFHSGGDDARATSFHPGFVSLVVPGFASSVDEISDCAVYEYREARFAQVSPAETARRFQLFEPEQARRPTLARRRPPWWSWKRYAPRLR